MNDIATDIVKRANSKGVSIAYLCREAGVTRYWFENLKKRVPYSVETYLKINRILDSSPVE